MNKSISENDYFRKYGLDSDPFPADVVDKNIFLTAEINRRLQLVRKQVKDSQKLLLVTSATGAGKSLLAQKLLVLKEADWRTSLTTAQENMSTESLAHSIVQQLVLDDDDSTTRSTSMVHKYLEQSYRESVVPVIVIDDAHKLPLETLQFVLQLADLRYNESLFRIVLFANESITETLAKPGLKELAEGIVDIVGMPGFSQEQIKPYLNFRFSACGEGIELPFTDDDLAYIHKASAGLPGGVNLLARQLMQEALKKDKPGSNRGTSTILLFLILLVLGAYFYYENRNLVNTRVAFLAGLQEGESQATGPENTSLAGKDEREETDESKNKQVFLSDPDDSLSLKLSEVLIMQSTERIESAGP